MTMKFSVLANMERFAPSDPPHAAQLAELAEFATAAEEGGFETFWLAEHHAIEFTAAPAPLNLISHLAGKVGRIRLGTAIVIAPYWHPIKLAGEAALTDLVCQGRLELGVARGAYQYEYDRLAGGMPATTGGRLLARDDSRPARAVGRGLCGGRGVLEISGRHVRAQAAAKSASAPVGGRARFGNAPLRRRRRMRSDGDSAFQGRQRSGGLGGKI